MCKEENTYLYCCLMSRFDDCTIDGNGFDIIVVVVAVLVE